MKAITKSFLFPVALVISSSTLANDNFTFGIGAGSLYSGLGVNAGIQSKTDLKYIYLSFKNVIFKGARSN